MADPSHLIQGRMYRIELKYVSAMGNEMDGFMTAIYQGVGDYDELLFKVKSMIRGIPRDWIVEATLAPPGTLSRQWEEKT